MAKQLKDSGVFGVELGITDIFQLMNTMELDLKVRMMHESFTYFIGSPPPTTTATETTVLRARR
jgi:hypothetical protein